MLAAYGWVIARSARAPYLGAVSDSLDAIDEEVDRKDAELFARLEQFLARFGAPDLDWHFRAHMNNQRGILLMSSSTNHRGAQPTLVEVLFWLAENGPGSYGLVHLHDDEDAGRRNGADYSNVFRVWRLLAGKVEELEDPFLSPIVPLVNPTKQA